NAAAQAQAVAKLEGILHDDERDIFLRGRNAKPRHQAPRSASCAQYAASTGFEALIGYLYLSGQKTRLEGLLLYLKSCE
ncbi:MAG TPA: Mini-ribonuclease 3, partial [Clostridia bacterium]|nr:Mini-ribonuclease 3 [Clostridia bacterium]